MPTDTAMDEVDADILPDPLAEAARLRQLRLSTIHDLHAAARRLRNSSPGPAGGRHA